MTQLSVIVPVYNTEQYLARCLDSLLDQDLDPCDYEILVIDDGSEDGSPAILEEYARTHPNIKVRTQPNQGPATARNGAIDEARGTYLFFVDSDDYIAAQSLGSLVRTACDNRLQVLAFDHERISHDEVRPAPPVKVPHDPEVLTGVEYVARHRYLSESTCYLFSAKLVRELGVRFDEGRIVEDVVLTATVVSSAERIAHVPVCFYYYVQRPGSIMNTAGAEHTLQLVGDYERVVDRLEELRQSWRSRGASKAFDHRLRVRQQTFVFFLIARLVRSPLPTRSVLPPVLHRLRNIGMYPMDAFPGGEFPGVRYRALTAVFNRPYLLWPFATAMSIAAHLAEHLGV